MPFGGLLTVGLIGAGASIFGGIEGSNAASKASQQQVAQEQKALDYTKQVEQPYLDVGNQGISSFMQTLQSGKFGAGSIPGFTAPTAAQAQATPGYEFTKQQGELGINRASASAGGAVTGGTLKALTGFNSGLASGTYQQSYNNALSGYQANLASQAQEFGQAFAPVQLGANVASGTATNVSNLMQGIGNSQAAGTVGSANALSQGINGAASQLSQATLANLLLGSGGGGLANTSNGALTIGPNGSPVPYSGVAQTIFNPTAFQRGTP